MGRNLVCNVTFALENSQKLKLGQTMKLELEGKPWKTGTKVETSNALFADEKTEPDHICRRLKHKMVR